MASFRALALLAAHPDDAARARDEVTEGTLELPFLRACVLESVRLWPTTPAILRDTTAAVRLGAATVPPGAAVMIFAPLFHRDPHLACADRFCPDLWRDRRASDEWPLVPFSAGPADCPGRNLVLLTASSLLARLMGDGTPRQARPALLRADEPLPATLSPFRLRFHLA